MTDALTGKAVIDANNYYPQRDGHFEELDSDRTTSSEVLQAHLPGAHVVKAFTAIQRMRCARDSTPSLSRKLLCLTRTTRHESTDDGPHVRGFVVPLDWISLPERDPDDLSSAHADRASGHIRVSSSERDAVRREQIAYHRLVLALAPRRSDPGRPDPA